jgi:hypothetical protein
MNHVVIIMDILLMFDLGAFGTVWLGRCRSIEVAVKVPNANRRITQRQLEAFQAEVKIMRYGY